MNRRPKSPQKKRPSQHGRYIAHRRADRFDHLDLEGVPLERMWRQALVRRLRAHLGAPVSVSITDNTHTMISFKRRRGEYRVRLHHMFLAASEPIVAALSRYLRNHEPAASALLDQFIAANKLFIRQVSPDELRARVPLQPAGEVHQLQEIFDRLNARYFDGRITATITYGRVPRVSQARQSIKLGSYSSESKLIRVHPALDQAWVPASFVEWIVFHEMLHHLLPAVILGGKRCVHTTEFQARERAFPGFERARQWEEENLESLLRFRSPREA
jgi:hypothetical protein